LAGERPTPEHLTSFYLWTSLGGALGGAFNVLVAPTLFNTVIEYPLAIVLVCLLLPRRERTRRTACAPGAAQPTPGHSQDRSGVVRLLAGCRGGSVGGRLVACP